MTVTTAKTPDEQAANAREVAPAPDTFAENNKQALAMTIPETASSDSAQLYKSDAETLQAVSDIPEDVRKNMVGFNEMELEEYILKTLGLFKTFVNVDRIVITLWLKHKYKNDRMHIQRRLRFMVAAGTVVKMEGKRGEYMLSEQGRALLG